MILLLESLGYQHWGPHSATAHESCSKSAENGMTINTYQRISTRNLGQSWTILDIYGLSFVWGFHVMAPFYPDLSQGERVKPLYRGTDHDVNPVPESNKIAGTQAKPLKTA